MAQHCLSAYCVEGLKTDECLDWNNNFGRLVFCKYCCGFFSADVISAINEMLEVL